MPTIIQWTHHLLDKIAEQEAYAAPYELRYRNEYVLPFITKEYRSVYGDRVDEVQLSPAINPPRTGVAAIGIDAMVERLTVEGADCEDPELVRTVEAAWYASDLDVMHREAHRESFVKARGFAQVVRTDDNKAIVGIDAPEQMAVHRQQAPPYDIDAAAKIIKDEWTGKKTVHLWLPNQEMDLEHLDQPVNDPEGSGLVTHWQVIPDSVKRGAAEVPVVEFPCRPRLLREPISDIEPIVSLVDLGDLIEGLMVFAGHFGAVPIRTVSGAVADPDLIKDPSGKTPLLGPDGKPMLGFNPRADHVWVSSSPDTEFGQLTPAGLETFVNWAEHVTSRIRAKTTVASTYYSLDLKSHMSAELLKTDEAPMVLRVNSVGPHGAYGQAWRRVNRHILAIEKPNKVDAMVKARWTDPNTRIEAQSVDSFQKAVASGLGVKFAAIKYLGLSPDEAEKAVEEARQAATVDPAIAQILRGTEAPPEPEQLPAVPSADVGR